MNIKQASVPSRSAWPRMIAQCLRKVVNKSICLLTFRSETQILQRVPWDLQTKFCSGPHRCKILFVDLCLSVLGYNLG